MTCNFCKTVMTCVDDVNTSFERIDWFRCSKCGSFGELIYNGLEVEKYTWTKNHIPISTEGYDD